MTDLLTPGAAWGTSAAVAGTAAFGLLAKVLLSKASRQAVRDAAIEARRDSFEARLAISEAAFRKECDDWRRRYYEAEDLRSQERLRYREELATLKLVHSSEISALNTRILLLEAQIVEIKRVQASNGDHKP